MGEVFDGLSKHADEVMHADNRSGKTVGSLKLAAAQKPKSGVKSGPSDLLDLPIRVAKQEDATAISDTNDLEPVVSPGRGIPFVSYVPDDLVALCSSGGGIRSGVFNLGVLQGLSRIGLLQLVDYHSTVSGGGYLGGWWSAWRAKNPGELFPGADRNLVEHASIRRLRERSRFLSPNGFALGAEVWRGIFLWAVGLVATLLMAFSVVALTLLAWSAVRAFAEWWGLAGGWSYLLFPTVLMLGLALTSELLTGTARVVTRRVSVGLFLAAGVFCAFNGVWAFVELAVADHPYFSVGSVLAVAGSSSGVIRWLSGWVAKRQQTKAPGSLSSQLSRQLPQLLAGIVVACMAFLILFGLLKTGSMAEPHDWLAVLVTTIALALAGHVLISVPSTLHGFYRSRIEESFLQTAEEAGEGNRLPQDWPDQVARPIHVVNCCASDTHYSTADQLDRRGASVSLSAVGAYPSGRGVMAKMASPTLSEALTASAAAVDPSMGIYSARLGRLVAFVLFAFNMRLGIWWQPNQATTPRKTLPMRYLVGRLSMRPWKEMLSHISLPTPSTEPDHKAYHNPGIDFRITDGGHFDNLAAYEMIRRRCRYVVICDGGADPGNHFAELASLQRLVRRDFGVEIEIDLDPLRVDAEGKSLRHLAAGRIRYPNSYANSEYGFQAHGVLIYVKPGLTGDEPEDLTQYQAVSPTFPHETTTDQFFDNRQWEAYRKLGEHSVVEDLGFVSRYLDEGGAADPKLAARLFDAAIRELGSEDHRIRTSPSRSSNRFADRLAKRPDGWIDELLSELSGIGDDDARKRARQSLLDTMSLLETLEESYYRCDLGRHGDHLENWGVENRADRVSESTEVRRWWPVVASLYSIPFRNYLGSRYCLNELLPVVDRRLVTLRFDKFPADRNDPAISRSLRRIIRARGEGAIDDGDWVLLATCPVHGTQIDLGALAFTLSEDKAEVAISINEMQVAPGYWSIGHNAILMDGLLEHFGFEVTRTVNDNKARVESTEAIDAALCRRVVVRNVCGDAEAVKRPEQRHSWIQRGFVQTRAGLLVRDQKDLTKAGLFQGSYSKS